MMNHVLYDIGTCFFEWLNLLFLNILFSKIRTVSVSKVRLFKYQLGADLAELSWAIFRIKKSFLQAEKICKEVGALFWREKRLVWSGVK